MIRRSDREPPVLVTGASGFTGQYVRRALESHGLFVAGMDASPSLVSSENTYVCNLLDLNHTNEMVRKIRPKSVIHLAAIPSVTHADKSQLYLVNIVGTRNLLSALTALDYTVQTVILASTANVYGNVGGASLDENTPPAPTNDYAVSKLSMEFMARTFSGRLPITIVRPFNYTGRGQTENFVIPKIVGHFVRRVRLLELGNLDVVREYGDVRRTAEAYARLTIKPQTDSVLNIATGQGITLNDVLQLCERLTGFRPEVRVNPALVRQNEVERLVGSCRRLEEAVGPLPLFTLQDTIEWMLA